MTNKKPLILITNDDGVDAPGIRLLTQIASQFGDVIVLAPAVQQSGMSSAVSCSSPVILKCLSKTDGVEVYSATGTPVDCVKLAFYSVCKERKPDFVLSGINKGANSSINVIYSGTMGATIEGCVNGIPSVGLSLCLADFSAPADYSFCVEHVKSVLADVIKNGLPNGVCLNVNFPCGKIEGDPVWCRQAKAVWTDEFTYVGEEADGSKKFMLGGNFVSLEPEADDTDVSLLDKHHTTIVPIRIDMTDNDFLKTKK